MNKEKNKFFKEADHLEILEMENIIIKIKNSGRG